MPTRRTALVLDGSGAQSVVAVRVLGALGCAVLTETGTRSARSRWTTGLVELPRPDAEPDGYLERLRRICADRGVHLVVPSTDLTLFLCWRAAREDDTIAGARVLSADRWSAEIFLDKLAGVRTAQASGFGVPETRAGNTAAAVVAACVELGFPCVVKPRRSFQLVGGRLRQLRHVIVIERAAAESAVRALTGDDGLLPIVQEYVEGRALAVTAVVHHRGVVAHSARETLSFYPLGGGTSVWKRTVPPDTEGVSEALAFLAASGLDGIAELEYKLSSAGPRFMEVGPRLHGWIPLAEVSAPGLLEAAVRAAFDELVTPIPSYRPNVEMRWIGGELRRLAALVRGPLLPGTSRMDVLRAAWPPWRPAMRYDAIDFSDPGPWLPAPFARFSVARRPAVARIAENDAPRTNRQ